MIHYHVGLAKRKRTLIIQASDNVDCLSCELCHYMGVRNTTKVQLRQNRYEILDLVQQLWPSTYGGLKYAVVE